MYYFQLNPYQWLSEVRESAYEFGANVNIFDPPSLLNHVQTTCTDCLVFYDTRRRIITKKNVCLAHEDNAGSRSTQLPSLKLSAFAIKIVVNV